VRFDNITRKLLAVVQKNNNLTSEAIGRMVGISASSVQRRLQKLREQGVIESEVAVLSPELLGQRLMVIVDIEMERENPTVLGELKKTMLRREEVMQCYYVTGRAADFVVILTLPDMPAYEKFCEEVIFSNKNIRKFFTSVVISRVKVGLSVPIDGADSGA
jgi:Lrp/AsnC family transcriptional regulator, leucine-responsive regulatory protein